MFLIQQMIKAAADNHALDVYDFSPASAIGMINVVSSNIADQQSLWANYGCLVNLFASRKNILSAWIRNRSVSTTSSNVQVFSWNGLGK